MNQQPAETASARHVVILYNAVDDDAGPDARDVLHQVDVVAEALAKLGSRVSRLACTLDLETVRGRLESHRPDVVFNLVESLGGSDRLAPFAAALLDALGIPYTGSNAEALSAAAGKLSTKRLLAAGGLPTPAWLERSEGAGRSAHPALTYPGRFIIKSLHEHASFGIDDDAVVDAGSQEELGEHLARREAVLNRPCFAEAFVAGREFNLSVLAGRQGPQVLPCAEIDFGAFPADKPHIVGYRAKWEADSFEYNQTPRRFDFSPADRALLERLSELARRAFELFGLGGYARVDFRVDRQGNPWILEVNTNPCLSPDAGFAAALDRARIAFPLAVERMIDDALAHPPARASARESEAAASLAASD